MTMQELELEPAELLPARETLWSAVVSPVIQLSTTFQSNNGNGDGNT